MQKKRTETATSNSALPATAISYCQVKSDFNGTFTTVSRLLNDVFNCDCDYFIFKYQLYLSSSIWICFVANSDCLRRSVIAHLFSYCDSRLGFDSRLYFSYRFDSTRPHFEIIIITFIINCIVLINYRTHKTDSRIRSATSRERTMKPVTAIYCRQQITAI